MYITITPQKLGSHYLQSAGDFVDYLEKENQGKTQNEMEAFFDPYDDKISAEEVKTSIDENTAKLKKKEPKFYSITINPSARELAHIADKPSALKAYTRSLMENYAKAFHREIEGRKITKDDILYFAKLEHQRRYKGTDRAVRENRPYIQKIARLQHEMVLIKKGEMEGSLQTKQQSIQELQQKAPHQQQGKMIEEGMIKEGDQCHIHVLVSRKDRSNRYSLSPGSKYKASTTMLHGKEVKRGFDRDQFFKAAEEVFDRKFQYRRNYVESYQARNTFLKHPERYFKELLRLPAPEKKIAFQLLKDRGVKFPLTTIPLTSSQLAGKIMAKLKKGITKAIHSGSIEL